ncbi:peptidase [Actinophytocola xinjiangensis]|uniref:Peptidase n=1 Tax=Actinophytocola xinjiangensis TaxID=485602 RepID=A0A7Z0WRC2_9PSEU|nr:Clp protease N-terminal domain-containing protein [Actinophytocola xinjiangensis]OLF12897.1 peptidase [Actinophytocola xinjiangensis]
MPKLNVYVPDDLAESVKETGLPVSAICQRALEQSVKRVGAIRATTIGDLDQADPTAGLTQFTPRAKQAFRLAVTRARDRGAAEIGTRDLLHGILTEGANLALRMLAALEVDPAIVLREVERLPTEDTGGEGTRLGRTAANALELTVVEAILAGHNYVGCEHLLLGLVAEPDGAGGEVLRGLGVETRRTRQIVAAALSGAVHLRTNHDQGDQLAQVMDKALEQILARLDRLEDRVGR